MLEIAFRADRFVWSLPILILKVLAEEVDVYIFIGSRKGDIVADTYLPNF